MESSRREFVAGGVTSALVRPAGAGSAEPDGTTRTAEQLAPLIASGGAERWWPLRVDLAPARWIWLPSQRVLPNTFVLFRKQFTLPALPSSALALVAADSRYRLTVNGHRVAWGPAPCDPRALDVDPADIRPFLQPGTNVIGVDVLFYGHGDGTWPAGKPGLLFHLCMDGPADGRIVSDESWLCRVDRAHRPGMYKRWYLRALQEEFDARLHPQGWESAGYQPGPEWLPAAALDCASGKPAACQVPRIWAEDTVDRIDPAKAALRLRQIPLCVETEVPALRLSDSGSIEWLRDPADWFEFRVPNMFRVDRRPAAVEAGAGSWDLPPTPGNERGVYATFEWKEHLVGWPSFTIDAPEGTVVEMMTQESHDPARTAWLDSHFFSWSRWTCRDGLNRFEAFDYESFRWMQLHVRGAARGVRISAVGARRKTFAWPAEPHVRCPEPAIQKLVEASVNTLRNSAIETIVDGMGRERQQYSGDGGHQLHAIRYAFGETRICRRYLRTFSEGLTPQGYFMDCWPAFDRLARVMQKQMEGAFWGPLLDHGVGFVFDCWNHYLETGEREALEEPYPRLLRFTSYLETLVANDGLLPVENLGIPTVWIDHEAYRHPRHKQCAFNLYVAAMLGNAMAKLAELFGDTARARRSRQLSEAIARAAVRRFWSPERTLFVDNLPWLAEEKGVRLSDRTLATAVLFDFCPAGRSAAAVETLAVPPPELGISYPCNAGWRYQALAKAGRIDAVLGDLRTRWAAMASVRANNSLQEMWTARPDSGEQWSHSALVPLYVLFMDIAGIRPVEPAFARCRVRPQLGDLPGLDLTARTVRGPIEFAARREGGVHRVRLALPAGCEADLAVPAGSKASLAAIAPGAPDGLTHYAVKAGSTAEFTIPAAPGIR